MSEATVTAPPPLNDKAVFDRVRAAITYAHGYLISSVLALKPELLETFPVTTSEIDEAMRLWAGSHWRAGDTGLRTHQGRM